MIFLKRGFFYKPLSLFLFTLVLASFVSIPAPRAKELTITSDRLEMDDQSQVAVFSGDVQAADGQMQLASDKMAVHYYKKHPRGSNRGGVREIHAEGRVVIRQADNHGTADEAIYNVKNRNLELIGKNQLATIRRGHDRLEGKQIIVTLGLDQKIDKVSVRSGGKKRVSARISSSGLVSSDEPATLHQDDPKSLPSPALSPEIGGNGEKDLHGDAPLVPPKAK